MDGDINAASVAIVADGKVLVIKRARPPYKGLWTLPGGRREPGESPEACAIREVREELGIAISGLAPVLVQDFRDAAGGAWRLSVFRAASFRGEPAPAPDEIADLAWFSAEELGNVRTTAGLQTILEQILGQAAAPS